MKQEIRTCSVQVAVRAVLAKDEDDAKLFQLEGVAASYDVLSPDVQGFRERIQKGAFQKSLGEGHDVRCLFNHDPSHVLGRTKSGTLSIFDLPKGLGFRCMLDAQNTQHQNVYQMVSRGDISQMSFAFSLPYDNGDEWDEAIDDETGEKFVRRTLKNVKLHDVSPVTYPYYSTEGATSVDARARLQSSAEKIDDFHRRRCAEIGRDLEADFQRRIAAAHEAVRNSALKDLGYKIK